MYTGKYTATWTKDSWSTVQCYSFLHSTRSNENYSPHLQVSHWGYSGQLCISLLNHMIRHSRRSHFQQKLSLGPPQFSVYNEIMDHRYFVSYQGADCVTEYGVLQVSSEVLLFTKTFRREVYHCISSAWLKLGIPNLP